MATRGPRFTGIPNVPQTGVSNWEYAFLSAVKENVELLTNTRSSGASATAAVLKGHITVNPPQQRLTQVTAQGNGFVVEGAKVVDQDDYIELIRNVQVLVQDVANLRATVELLITQLRN